MLILHFCFGSRGCSHSGETPSRGNYRGTPTTLLHPGGAAYQGRFCNVDHQSSITDASCSLYFQLYYMHLYMSNMWHNYMIYCYRGYILGVFKWRPMGHIRPTKGCEMARQDTEMINNFSNTYEIFLDVFNLPVLCCL